MKVLFVHQNFPGQFLHLAPALKAQGHEVAALTVEGNARPSPVTVWRYRFRAPEKQEGPGATYAEAAGRGAAAARAAQTLRQKHGFAPDVVFGHGGWGETLFLREVFPEARHLTYAEFFYRTSGLDTGFDLEFWQDSLDARIRVVARTAHHLQVALAADACLSPTEWQASTFPSEVRSKLTVIHDGVDTAKLAPNPAATLPLPDTDIVLRPGDEVVSFVSRHLEPYRGYHRFMRALPAILRARPNARAVIVGGDGQSYGPRPAEGTWKEKFLNEVKDDLDLNRVHFLGQVPYATFAALMQVTRVHVYLTYPFVLSWSMLEAMSAGALVVGSRTPPVQEAIEDGRNGLLVDFFDTAALADTVIAALADPRAHDALRLAARQSVVERYDLRTRCLPRLIDFVMKG